LIWKGSVFLPGSPQIWLNHGDSQRAQSLFRKTVKIGVIVNP
jgi:hypothetical protein